MATRLYLASSGTPAITPVQDGIWDEVGSAFDIYPCDTTKSNTALTDFAHSALTAATQESLLSQFVTVLPLDVNQTITGTVDIVLRGLQGSASHNSYLAFVLKVCQPDGSLRGVLAFRATTSGGVEWGTGARTRIWSGITLSSVAAQAGDYLAMDVGTYQASPGAGPTMTYRYGDPTATADFALTSNLTTDLCSWFELSQTLTFGTPSGGPANPGAFFQLF